MMLEAKEKGTATVAAVTMPDNLDSGYSPYPAPMESPFIDTRAESPCNTTMIDQKETAVNQNRAKVKENLKEEREKALRHAQENALHKYRTESTEIWLENGTATIGMLYDALVLGRIESLYQCISLSEGLLPYITKEEEIGPDGKKRIREGLDPSALAYFVAEHVAFIRVEEANGEDLYLYEDGIYQRKNGTADLLEIVQGCVRRYKRGLLNITNGKGYERAFRILIDGVDRDTAEFGIFATRNHHCTAEEMQPPENLIALENGVLDLDTMQLYAPSPQDKLTVKLPCEWHKAPPDTPCWDSYFDFLLSGNEAEKRLVLQYIGAILSNVPGYRWKKCLFLIGKGDCGKSLLRHLVGRLVGEQNDSGLDPSNFNDRFTAADLFGKRVVGSADVKTEGNMGDMSMLKQLTGSDLVRAEFKGRDSIGIRFRGLLFFCANKLPPFGGDKGDHVYERLMIINCKQSVPESKRDPDLLEKLWAEREGIVHKAIIAFKDVLRNNRFDIPESVVQAVEDYKLGNDIVRQFLNDCMTDRPHPGKIEDRCTKGRLYPVFKAWADDNGIKFPPIKRKFFDSLANKGYCFSKTKGDLYDKDHTLNREAKEAYKGVYGTD